MTAGESGAANTIIPFGRFKGRRLGSLSLGYLKWASIHWSQHQDIDDSNIFADLAKQVVRERTTFNESEFAEVLLLPPPPKMLNHLDTSENRFELAAYASMLRWCGNTKSLDDGRKVHLHIARHSLQHDPHLCHLIIQMYGECGALDDAYAFFSAMDSPNVLTCNFMMRAYARHGYGEKVLQTFHEMLNKEVGPDKITILHALRACACVSDGRVIHSIVMNNGLDTDTIVTNAMISMYGQCWSSHDAQTTFAQSRKPNIITWNAMISACVHNDLSEQALCLFWEIQQQGAKVDNVTYVSTLDACIAVEDLAWGKRLHVYVLEARFEKDVSVGTTLINMYGKCGSLENARRSFEDIHQRNTICWTAMMAAYVEKHKSEDALRLLSLMDEEGLHPTKITFIIALDACADIPNLFMGEILVNRIKNLNGSMNDIKISTALINMYGRCGNVEEARQVFDNMSMVHDLGSWNAMIATYSLLGQVNNTFHLFEQMKLHGMRPNIITYVSILSACSHEGLVREACQVFSSMNEYNVSPVEHHYNCMIDLLARAGRLDEAELLVRNIHLPSFVPAMTLLAACKTQVDVKRGVRMANLILHLGLKSNDTHMVVSSIRAARMVQAVHEATTKLVPL